MYKYEESFTLSAPVSVLSCHRRSKIQQKGGPWHNEMQQVPGRIEFEYYDEGGEGVAYHDSGLLTMGAANSILPTELF